MIRKINLKKPFVCPRKLYIASCMTCFCQFCCLRTNCEGGYNLHEQSCLQRIWLMEQLFSKCAVSSVACVCGRWVELSNISLFLTFCLPSLSTCLLTNKPAAYSQRKQVNRQTRCQLWQSCRDVRRQGILCGLVRLMDRSLSAEQGRAPSRLYGVLGSTCKCWSRGGLPSRNEDCSPATLRCCRCTVSAAADGTRFFRSKDLPFAAQSTIYNPTRIAW